MKTILAGGILASILASAVMAEGERRSDGAKPNEGGRPPHDGEKRPFLGGPDEMFKHMDRDGDGNISKREFFASPRMERLPEQNREEIFGRLDRDGDGFIEREEIMAMRRDNERRAMGQFQKLDTDKSGGLDFEEFSKGELFGKLPEEKRRQIFTRMDTDGNGEINGADKPKGPPGKSDIRPERKPKG